MNNWTVPNEPELLYLREKIKRLEAELSYYRGISRYTIDKPPTEVKLSKLPRIYQLLPLVTAEANFDDDPTAYHVLLSSGESTGKIAYGYYVSRQELYTISDRCGLMAELHKRTVHALAKFLENNQ